MSTQKLKERQKTKNTKSQKWFNTIIKYTIITVRLRSEYTAFGALTLLAVQQEGHHACKKLSGGMLAWLFCLGRGADLHMVQLMSLPLTISCSSKSRSVLPPGFTHYLLLQ